MGEYDCAGYVIDSMATVCRPLGAYCCEVGTPVFPPMHFKELDRQQGVSTSSSELWLMYFYSFP